MKKSDSILKEYVRRLSDDDLAFLNIRFKQNLCGDRADIANFASRDSSVDRWLATATDPDEWFDKLDSLGESIRKERSRREEGGKD